jgi:hypothetical protein
MAPQTQDRLTPRYPQSIGRLLFVRTMDFFCAQRITNCLESDDISSQLLTELGFFEPVPVTAKSRISPLTGDRRSSKSAVRPVMRSRYLFRDFGGRN